MMRNTEQSVAWAQNGRRAAAVLSITVCMSAVVLALAAMLNNVWLDIVLLGIVEGVTEFLPVSSTGHLLIASEVLGFPYSLGGTFEIVIQLGAVFAVLLYYRRDLYIQVRAAPYDRTVQHFWLRILIAFVPAAVVGLFLRDWIKLVLFTSPLVIAWSLILGGCIFLLVDRFPQRATVDGLHRMTRRQALAVGLVQVLALVPGVSRSGASIIGGRLAGLDRATATNFSFYLAIPTLGAATVVDLVESLSFIGAGDVFRLALGAGVALIVAWLCIGWLLRYVTNHSFALFGMYRIVAGSILLVLISLGLV